MPENRTGGFNRNLRLDWMDATGALAAEGHDGPELRRRLEAVIGPDFTGSEGLRKTIDVLVNIWVRTEEVSPKLRTEALERFRRAENPGDRVWMHYGLTLLRYPLFRDATAAIGKTARLQEWVAPEEVKRRLVALRGALGSMEKSVERVFTSLADWGLLERQGKGQSYLALRNLATTQDQGLQVWLLACALAAHPGEEITFTELVRLPELFPFRLPITLVELRQSPGFAVQRQGGGWDMVRLAG